MKKFLFTCIAAFAVCGADAQFNYSFTKDTLAYQPLNAGTSVNGNIVWDDEFFKVPIGFSFNMDGIAIDSISVVSANIFTTDTLGTVNGFLPTAVDLLDRNYDSGTVVSYSPIRYQLTGTTPNRILKVEIANAGFYDEWDMHNSLNDSVSYQVWLYETSNIVEFHYGPSQLTYPDDYFVWLNDSAVVNIGYFSQLNVNSFNVDNFYYLVENGSSITIDSASNITNSLPSEGLENWPANGTVFRFTPFTVSVKDAMATLKSVNVYPTLCSNEIFVENTSSAALSYDIVSLTGSVSNISGKLQSGKQSVDLSQLPAGNYLIRVHNGTVGRAVKFTRL